MPYNIKAELLGMYITLLETWYIIDEKIITWNGPGTVIRQDGKQILVKHESVYVHVDAYRIIHAIENDDNNGSNNKGDFVFKQF